MKKSRGFRLGRRLIKIFKCVGRRKTKTARYRLLENQAKFCNPISKVCNLVRSLQRGAKELCSPRSDYKRLGQDPFSTKQVEVPKGHLAVYVGGGSNDDTRRVLVPVIYFNHPLFNALLKEAERVYGYDHPGGITIPCGMSEFEKVQTRIAAGEHGRRPSWRRRYW